MPILKFTLKQAKAEICDECLKNTVAINQYFIFAYCKHNFTGGMLAVIGGEPGVTWLLQSPITKDDFILSINEAYKRRAEAEIAPKIDTSRMMN